MLCVLLMRFHITETCLFCSLSGKAPFRNAFQCFPLFSESFPSLARVTFLSHHIGLDPQIQPLAYFSLSFVLCLSFPLDSEESNGFFVSCLIFLISIISTSTIVLNVYWVTFILSKYHYYCTK